MCGTPLRSEDAPTFGGTGPGPLSADEYTAVHRANRIIADQERTDAEARFAMEEHARGYSRARAYGQMGLGFGIVGSMLIILALLFFTSEVDLTFTVWSKEMTVPLGDEMTLADTAFSGLTRLAYMLMVFALFFTFLGFYNPAFALTGSVVGFLAGGYVGTFTVDPDDPILEELSSYHITGDVHLDFVDLDPVLMIIALSFLISMIGCVSLYYAKKVSGIGGFFETGRKAWHGFH